VNLLRLHQEELENCLQEIFPGVVIKIVARGIPVEAEGTKEDTFIYKPEDSETEYLITSSGANDMAPEWYNDKLFLSFVKMHNKK
jgi:hypothetical protein